MQVFSLQAPLQLLHTLYLKEEKYETQEEGKEPKKEDILGKYFKISTVHKEKTQLRLLGNEKFVYL